jgi:hypothetical protein
LFGRCDRPEKLLQAAEEVESAPGIATAPEAEIRDDAFRGNRVRHCEERPPGLTRGDDAIHAASCAHGWLRYARHDGYGPTAPNDRPENPPQDLEKMDFAPGLATESEASCDADAAREAARAWTRPEPRQDEPLNDRPENPPQDFENVESAPGNGCAAKAPSSGEASDVVPTVPNPIGFRRVNVRMTLNGVMAC